MATVQEIRNCLDLAPEYALNGSGLKWKAHRQPKRLGTMAGSKHGTGYYCLKVKGKSYQASHIVALLADIKGIDKVRKSAKTGSTAWVVDHIDTNKSHNAPDNLQVLTNMQNVAKDKKPSSGYTGVYQHGDKFRWQVFHEVKGARRTKSMSGFESALAAYVSRTMYLESLKEPDKH